MRAALQAIKRGVCNLKCVRAAALQLYGVMAATRTQRCDLCSDRPEVRAGDAVYNETGFGLGTFVGF